MVFPHPTQQQPASNLQARKPQGVRAETKFTLAMPKIAIKREQ